jgi:hypothetical protein
MQRQSLWTNFGGRASSEQQQQAPDDPIRGGQGLYDLRMYVGNVRLDDKKVHVPTKLDWRWR